MTYDSIMVMNQSLDKYFKSLNKVNFGLTAGDKSFYDHQAFTQCPLSPAPSSIHLIHRIYADGKSSINLEIFCKDPLPSLHVSAKSILCIEILNLCQLAERAVVNSSCYRKPVPVVYRYRSTLEVGA